MRFSGKRDALAAALLLWVSCGCVATPVPHVSKSVPPGSAYLLHLPGVSGTTIFDQWWLNALHEGGAAGKVDVYDWTGNHSSMIEVLHAYDENHAAAGRIAQFIVQTRQSNPAVPIVLTAESGGTGIAVWALEAMPAGVTVNDVLLVSPVISPHYDLTAALCHVSGTMYYSTSPVDIPTNAGDTLLFGTIDGKRTLGAGLVGFRRPRGTDTSQYSKLVELKYDPMWIVWGNFGLHTGGMSAPFARHVLAPLLVRDEQRMAAEAANPPGAVTPTPKPASRIQRSVALPQ